MSEKRFVDDIITKFVLNTCRILPQPSKYGIIAAAHCASVARQRPPEYACDKDVRYIPLITGSMAEFYIEPMLPHVNDMDIMRHVNAELAIPRGHPPPTLLPAEFHNYLKVFEIIDSHLPGYVYLKLCYLLTKCTDSSSYNSIEYKKSWVYLSIQQAYHCDVLERHGPAFSSHFGLFPFDIVRCVRCLSWLTQAADWPKRHRNHSWPDSATVDYVVSNGCDVVNVAHCQCRQYELLSQYQWRMSFSRAEITLINSWMPLQQIIYHILRVFLKTDKLIENVNNSIAGMLSNYHIKTLMLWACELKPKSWWTDDLRLVRICIHLLHTLGVWLTETRCQNYFISDCNLVDSSFAFDMIASRLLSVHIDWLSSWFVNTYIKRSAAICPDSVSQLFDDVSTTTKLVNAVSVVCAWKLNTVMKDMWHAFDIAEYLIAFCLSFSSMNEQSVLFVWMTELSKTDACFCVFLAAVASLHIAHKMASDTSIANFIKTLTMLSSQFSGLLNFYNQHTFSLLNKVVILASKCQMQTMNSIKCNTSEMVGLLQEAAVELLTAFRQLEARNFNFKATIVTEEFQALYAYKCGDYQQCFQLSIGNVYTLLYASYMRDISTFPEFILLLDDDIVSLTALTLIVNPKCRWMNSSACISQLTLSLYLMAQCQLKLHHSVKSLAQTQDFIKVAQRRHEAHLLLNRLTLKLTELKLVSYIIHIT